jgi:hypothetical protein
MGLFRKKSTADEDAERCPHCRERVPAGAVECMMCGVALEPLRSVESRDEAKASGGRRRDGIVRP